jgi:transcriptional regulator with XRE-family HTH domain
MTPKPGWIADRGELVRAHRLYTGLSQRTFAERCGLKEKSLSDIEIGRRDMPEGFIDTVADVVAQFDDEVDQVIRRAESIIGDDERHAIEFRVTDDDNDEWARVVIGRAAVTSDDLILPILDGIHQQEDRAG